MASSSTDSQLPLNTLLHMLSIKLSSTNYLLWKNQMVPILTYQNLLSHVDGSSNPPAKTIVQADKTIDNPGFSAWLIADQKTVIILHASLSEEAVSVVVGLSSARDIWVALEATYCNSSVDRVQNLRDQLRLIQKGDSSVAEFGRTFKHLCDQLRAIGHPVDASDQLHWFLCGLGPTFESFSTSIRSSRPPPSLSDLVAKAESHELFVKSILRPSHNPVAFSTQTDRPSSSVRGRGGRNFRGSASIGGRNRGRRLPHCQLCRTDGHYANACPKLSSFAKPNPTTDEKLASAFHAQCHVTSNGPDWYVDTGASDHMTASSSSISNATPSTGSTNQSGSGPGKS